MMNYSKHLWEIQYLQSPIEIKKIKFTGTINELNEKIDRMRKMNTTILEIVCLKSISY